MAIYPNFVLPDVGGELRQLGQDLVTSTNARTQRMFAEDEQRRSSAREAMERDKEARQAAKEELDAKMSRWNALPNVLRMAQQSPEMANANPWGIKVESETQQPSPIAHALPIPSNPTIGTPTGPLQGPTPEGPPLSQAEGPLQGPMPTGAPLATSEVPPPAEEPPAPEAMRHIFATVNGQRFEAPKPEKVAGDADWGTLYDHFLTQTGDPIKAAHEADAHVASTRGMAGKERALADAEAKQKALEAEWLRTHPDVATQDAWKHIVKPGKGAGGGGGGGAANPGMAELIRMKEQGQPDSAIAARAAQLRIPMGGKGGYLQATKEVRAAGNATARIDERKAQETVIGPDGQAMTGINPKLAGKAGEANVAFAQVKSRLQHLIDDVATNGTRVAPWDIEGVKRRQSAAGEVVAALRKYNELNATDASIKLEHEITGGAGTLGDGLWSGAQPGVLQHLLQEAEARHGEQLKNYTRPQGGGHAELPVGTVKNGMRKVGPNDWQPVTQ